MAINNSWQLSEPEGYNDRHGGGATATATCAKGHRLVLNLSTYEWAQKKRFIDLIPPDCPDCVAEQEVAEAQRDSDVLERDGMCIGAFE